MRTFWICIALLACVALAMAEETTKTEEKSNSPSSRKATDSMRAPPKGAESMDSDKDKSRKKYSEMTADERKAERESKRSDRQKQREDLIDQQKRKQAATKPSNAGANAAANNRPEKGEFRGTAGMFMALVAPVKPVAIKFPLDEETKLKFSAARDGLMQYVRKQSKDMDTKSEEVKNDLRAKTTTNQDKTLEIILEAVKSGMTVQEARMGIVIAQYDALDEETKKSAMEKAKVRSDRLPEGSKAKMTERLDKKNQREKEQLAQLKTDKEKEDYVRKVYRPQQAVPGLA